MVVLTEGITKGANVFSGKTWPRHCTWDLLGTDADATIRNWFLVAIAWEKSVGVKERRVKEKRDEVGGLSVGGGKMEGLVEEPGRLADPDRLLVWAPEKNLQSDALNRKDHPRISSLGDSVVAIPFMAIRSCTVALVLLFC